MTLPMNFRSLFSSSGMCLAFSPSVGAADVLGDVLICCSVRTLSVTPVLCFGRCADVYLETFGARIVNVRNGFVIRALCFSVLA